MRSEGFRYRFSQIAGRRYDVALVEDGGKADAALRLAPGPYTIEAAFRRWGFEQPPVAHPETQARFRRRWIHPAMNDIVCTTTPVSFIVAVGENRRTEACPMQADEPVVGNEWLQTLAPQRSFRVGDAAGRLDLDMPVRRLTRDDDIDIRMYFANLSLHEVELFDPFFLQSDLTDTSAWLPRFDEEGEFVGELLQPESRISYIRPRREGAVLIPAKGVVGRRFRSPGGSKQGRYQIQLIVDHCFLAEERFREGASCATQPFSSNAPREPREFCRSNVIEFEVVQ